MAGRDDGRHLRRRSRPQRHLPAVARQAASARPAGGYATAAICPTATRSTTRPTGRPLQLDRQAQLPAQPEQLADRCSTSAARRPYRSTAPSAPRQPLAGRRAAPRLATFTNTHDVLVHFVSKLADRRLQLDVHRRLSQRGPDASRPTPASAATRQRLLPATQSLIASSSPTSLPARAPPPPPASVTFNPCPVTNYVDGGFGIVAAHDRAPRHARRPRPPTSRASAARTRSSSASTSRTTSIRHHARVHRRRRLSASTPPAASGSSPSSPASPEHQPHRRRPSSCRRRLHLDDDDAQLRRLPARLVQRRLHPRPDAQRRRPLGGAAGHRPERRDQDRHLRQLGAARRRHLRLHAQGAPQALRQLRPLLRVDPARHQRSPVLRRGLRRPASTGSDCAPDAATGTRRSRTTCMRPRIIRTRRSTAARSRRSSPTLKGQYSEEVVAGIQYDVGLDMVLGASYIHRDLGRVIEDVSPDGGNTYIISQPRRHRRPGRGQRSAEQDRDSPPIRGCTRLRRPSCPRANAQQQLALYKDRRRASPSRRATTTRSCSRPPSACRTTSCVLASYTYSRTHRQLSRPLPAVERPARSEHLDAVRLPRAARQSRRSAAERSPAQHQGAGLVLHPVRRQHDRARPRLQRQLGHARSRCSARTRTYGATRSSSCRAARAAARRS